MTVTLDDIRRLVGTQLGLDAVGGDDRIVEDLGAESFDVLNIVSALEERYDVELDDEEAAAIETVADLYRLVRKKAEGGPP